MTSLRLKLLNCTPYSIKLKKNNVATKKSTNKKSNPVTKINLYEKMYNYSLKFFKIVLLSILWVFKQMINYDHF